MLRLDFASNRAFLVPRPRLLRLLTEPVIAPITLIIAPAGYGKSTLAAQWAAGHPQPVAWLSLTAEHNTPARFLEDLYAALAPSAAGAQTDLGAITCRLQELAHEAPGALLVLDDLHVIASQEVLDSLEIIVATLPEGIHLVLLSRTVPKLALARHRLDGHVRELTSRDLGFTVQEVRELLARVSVGPLPAKVAWELALHSEGWIAGIQLAVASSHETLPVFDTWSTQHRLDDYVVEEVLAELPEELRLFVLKTAFLPYLDPDLCNSVLEIETSAELVAAASRQLSFVRPVDPTSPTLTYHVLFAESVLRLSERQFSTSERRHRQLRAAAWFGQRGQFEQALNHAIQAEEWEQAKEYARVVGRDLMDHDQSASRLFWLQQLPEDLILSDPDLAWFYISALLYVGQHRVAIRLLPRAEELWQRSPNPIHHGYRESVRSFFALLDGSDRLGILYRALNFYPVTNVVERFHLWTAVMQAEFDQGNHEIAAEALRQARACRAQLPAVQQWSIIPDYSQANLVALHGDLPTAIELFRTALAELPEWARGHSSRYHASLAALHLERNELDAAAAEAEQIEQGLRDYSNMGWDPEMWLVIARVEAAQGRSPLTALQRAQDMQLQRGGGKLLRLQIEGLRAMVWLDKSEIGPAAAWATLARHEAPWRRAQFYDFDPRLVAARALIAAGRATEARVQLDPLVVEARDAKRWTDLIGLLVWTMGACLAVGDEKGALSALDEALHYGRPGGFVRSFLPAGLNLTTFYRMATRRLPAESGTYIEQMLLSRTSLAPSQALSGRELEVLRLLSDGASNQEIAAHLFVTVSTVKKHISSILRKLNAPNRTAAIVRARELGIIS